MKTSTLIVSLLIINSSFLAGQISIQLIGNINPLILGASELFLAITYYIHTIIRDVRNTFDVDVKL
ncbi:hypothetical protein [Jejuia pallidilutea]|jgi:hypothetical protein|uniref:Uncharacterized protein n=1 Tax=Jejuia pallidilutea TaxID=504487 RepID=A0A090WFS2_9FLAO|nr:hypothetical protein [Jejuia pallidilutea]PQV51685.1 hypothetical protein CLV33_101613 [Jejuia pallidilutea]GAL66367.1 hypothetical protein JCM19301_2462 [Jejuia pallidilutea]GAL69618.1 hypothetical protein JCM19302_3807 [Jejuia pallidilutea]GAL87925.1 hypothetical protein JCM19538_2288 [Jejuia pallidilutea]